MSTAQVLLLFSAVTVMIGVGVLFLLRHRIYAAQAWRKFERMRRDDAAGIPPNPRDYHYRIDFDSVGLTATNLRDAREHPVTMQWSNVRRAVAFKRDIGMFDCVCLVLSGSDGCGIELNEEMARWNSLVRAMPKHLPGCMDCADWISTVAYPPFATNETEIFSGEATPSVGPAGTARVG